MTTRVFLRTLGLVLAGLASACGGGSGSGGGPAAQPGTLAVSLTDAPSCGFEEVSVTVRRIRVHQSSTAGDNAAGWTDIAVDPTRNRINLLDLTNGTLSNLGQVPLAAGRYTQLRMELDPAPTANSVVLSTSPSTETPLDAPSGSIKLVHQFDVASGQRVDLLLDFDACASIVKTTTGNITRYKLKPVIKVIPFAVNGIQGFVDQNLLNNHVVVSAQVGGEVVRSTLPLPNGAFILSNLPPDPQTHAYPANYDVVITADNYATGVIASVPVLTAPSLTVASTEDAPILLPASTTQDIGVGGTVTLSPDTNDASVAVAATQTLNDGSINGLTVTVQSRVATIADPLTQSGAYRYLYSLALPTAAPWLAPFNTGALPLTFSATNQSGVANLYTVKGRGQLVTTSGTTVYATQNPLPAARDISLTANQTQDFTLSAP